VRLELAEMLSQREQYDAALELLESALEDNPPLELAERLHLQIATCLIAKDEWKRAQSQTEAVIKNPASSVMGEALFLAGEAGIQGKDWPNAIAQLAAFRDKDPFRNMNVLTERALLRLGQAFAQALRWDESRQAFEILTQRFPQSPLVYEARFGMGSALQNANQLDNAYNVFTEVTRRSAGVFAAQAQLQMGKIRLAQKRYPEALKDLLVVASTYEYRDLNAEALCEAGQVYFEQQQTAEAAKIWQSVIKDYAESKWGETAKKRLAGIK
jgi:TolA-binding protein